MFRGIIPEVGFLQSSLLMVNMNQKVTESDPL